MKRLVGALLILTLFCAVSAVADTCGVLGNLVTNCGFETGDTTGWTYTPASSGSSLYSVTTVPHSGVYGAVFFAVGGEPDTLEQTLGTIAGHSYTFTFWIENDAVNPVFPCETTGIWVCSFSADWNGSNVYTAPIAGFGYTQITFSGLLATGNSSISFRGFNTPAAYYLDDVSVVDNGPAAVPEPSSLLLLVTGLIGTIGAMRRKLTK